jgi:predicted Rossmann-fold nucleotide-binding protein
MSLVQLEQRSHQLGIVNTDGFYDGTISQLSKMTEEGFVPKKSQE